MGMDKISRMFAFLLQILRQPDGMIEEGLKNHRHGQLDPETLGECEKLVSDWILTIESIVGNSVDERYDKIEICLV